MSGNTDSACLTEVSHQTTGSTAPEHEYQSRFERLYDWAFTAELPTLSGSPDEEFRRLTDHVESPIVRRWLGLDDTGDDSHGHEHGCGDGWAAEAGLERRHSTNTDRSTDDESEVARGSYGWFYGQPMVASRSDERRAKMNATGKPSDAISEPDVLRAGEYVYLGHDRLTDPTGDQLTGTASGLEEYIPVSSTDAPVQLRTTLVPTEHLDDYTRRLRERMHIPEDERTPRGADGVGPYDLEVTLPTGEVVPLRSVVPNLEDYTRSSIPGIERRLALDAEIAKVSAGIHRDGFMTGVAACLDAHTDALALYRTLHDRTIPDRRKQRFEQCIYDLAEPLRELDERDPELRKAVLSETRRLLDGTAVHAIRKKPVAVAADMAQRVLDGDDVTAAFLSVLEAERRDPSNVLRVNAILEADLASSRGYVTTQGVVKTVYHPPVPGMKFAMILQDGERREDEVRVSVWESSEYERTASTADPDDVDGRVIVSKKVFEEPREGDVVRLRDFKLPREKSRQTYAGQPKLDSRWESELEILERAPVEASARETSTPQRIGRPHPTDEGDVVPRSAVANFEGTVTIDWPEPATVSSLIAVEFARTAETVRATREQYETRQAARRTARTRRVLNKHPDAAGLFVADTLVRLATGDAPRDSSTCWVCGLGTEATMDYDPVLLTKFHPLCLTRAGVEDCKEYTEKRLAEYTGSLERRDACV